MAYTYNHGLTPYHETRLMQGGTQHNSQPQTHATAPYKFPDATLDEGSTLRAIYILKNSLPLPVLKHIVQLPPKCIEALLVLLNQVQNNISVDWLTNVVAALDPEDKRITVSPTQPQPIHDDGSFWTNSSATTCHMSGLSVDGGIGLSRQASSIPSTYDNSFYYQAVLPNNSFDNNNLTYNAEINLADTAIMDSPFDSQPDIPQFDFGTIPAYNELQFDTFPQKDFVLIESSTPDLASNEPNPYAMVFPSLEHNQSESTIGTQRSNTVRKRRSRRSTKASTQDGSLNIQMFEMPQVPVEDRRSPCPHCDSTFVSHTEFAAHIVAEHDRPVVYRCSHTQCAFVTCRPTLLNRHHTSNHKDCPMPQPRGVGTVTPCRFERQKPNPRKVWGCWLCTWETRSGAESWARHQLEQHKSCQKDDMSHNWLIKSLLSQPRLRSTWQAEIKQLEKDTNTVWNLRWSDSRGDAACSDLIDSLETGLWQDRNYLTDDFARHAIIKAAMEATKENREALSQAPRQDKGSGKRPLSPAPMSLRRLRSFGQNLRNRFTHDTMPAPDTSGLISTPRRQDSLPIRSSGRNRPATSHEIVSG